MMRNNDDGGHNLRRLEKNPFFLLLSNCKSLNFIAWSQIKSYLLFSRRRRLSLSSLKPVSSANAIKTNVQKRPDEVDDSSFSSQFYYWLRFKGGRGQKINELMQIVKWMKQDI